MDDLDGFFTFAIGTREGFAVLRDGIACKPAVLAETDQWVAMASEYRSIAHLPGAAQRADLGAGAGDGLQPGRATDRMITVDLNRVDIRELNQRLHDLNGDDGQDRDVAHRRARTAGTPSPSGSTRR